MILMKEPNKVPKFFRCHRNHHHCHNIWSVSPALWCGKFKKCNARLSPGARKGTTQIHYITQHTADSTTLHNTHGQNIKLHFTIYHIHKYFVSLSNSFHYKHSLPCSKQWKCLEVEKYENNCNMALNIMGYALGLYHIYIWYIWDEGGRGNRAGHCWQQYYKGSLKKSEQVWREVTKVQNMCIVVDCILYSGLYGALYLM